MPQFAVLGLGILVVLVVALAPIRVSFATFVATLILIPASLTLPNGVTSYLTIHNAVLGAGILALVRERRSGNLPNDLLRPSPVQVALAAFVGVVVICGVGLAEPTIRTPALQHGLLDVVAQLVVLTLAVLYARLIDDHRFLIGVLAGTLLVFGLIAVGERVTGQSFGQFLFRHSSAKTDASFPLVRRAGKLRVRSSAEFALEYAWMVLMLAPALVTGVLLVSWRRMVVLAIPTALVVATVYWSVSRSAIAAAPVAVIVVWIGLRWNKRITVSLAMLGLLLAVLLSVRPQLTTVLRTSTDQGSVQGRSDRLPLVAQAVVHRPIQGLGIGGLDQLGIPSTDASYNQVYAELGILGVAAFGLALLTALFASGRGLFSVPQPNRMVATIGFAGVLMGVLGSAAFDLFATRGSSQLFWLLAGIGAVGAERCRGALAPAYRPSGFRWTLPVGGVVAGALIALVVPRHAVSTSLFLVSTPVSEASGTTFVTDQALGQTACGVAVDYGQRHPGRVECRELISKEGVRELRVEARSRAKVVALDKAVVDRVAEVIPSLRTFPLPGPVLGKPTAAKTAPIWLGCVGLGFAVLFPGLALRETSRRWSQEGWASPLP